MTRVVRDSLFLSGARRSIGRSLVYLALIAAGVLLVGRDAMRLDPHLPISAGDHSRHSLNQALNRVYCSESNASDTYDIAAYEATRPGAMEVPFEDLIVERAGSLAAYCATARFAFVNGENSLMYFAETVTRLHRRASLATYGAAIHGFVVVVSLLFAFALIHSGAGLALVAVALAIPLLLFADSSSYTYSTYVFFLPLVLLNVAWYTLALLFSWSSTLARHTATIFGAGLLAAFSFNMRTSYLPTYVLFGALYCVFTFRRTHPSLRWPDWRRPALVWVAASIGVYALAIALFHALFIRPLVPARPSNQ